MDTKKLVGAVVLAAVLAGCGHNPAAVKATGEPEVRLSLSKLKQSNTPKPLPSGEATTPPWVVAKNAEVAARQAAQKAAAAAPKPVAKATPKPAPSGAPAAQATSAPRLMLLAQPDPVILAAGTTPAPARFEVQAPADGVLVAKAKIEVVGAGDAQVLEVSVAELGWPTKLAYATELTVPFDLAMTALAQDPAAKQLKLRATPIGPDGVALTGADGKPLALEVRVDVQ